MDRQDEDEKAFLAYQASLGPRSVLDLENERIAKAYPADEALLKHGREIEDEITRTLMRDAKVLPRAVLLEFPAPHKIDNT